MERSQRKAVTREALRHFKPHGACRDKKVMQRQDFERVQFVFGEHGFVDPIFLDCFGRLHCHLIAHSPSMAAVYKSLSKKAGSAKPANGALTEAERKTRQRVLILSSRGVTYRFAY